jgi:glycosyltransferase involved in cell wall biosynthesis
MKNRQLPYPESGKSGWPWVENLQEGGNDLLHQTDHWPKISVITPSYNQGKFIEKTIRSVLLQRYPNLEYIVIDGGSTDNTVSIIEKYSDYMTYRVSEKDNGQAHAINKGFGRATGEIYAWLNSDDYYLPGALFKVAQEFQKHPEAGVIVGTGHKVLENGRVVYTPKIPELNYNAFLNWSYSHFMQPSCFFRSAVWKASGPLREDLNYCLDVDLWLKMAKSFEFHRFPESLSHALIHPDAKTTAERERMKVETALMVYQHGAHDIARDTLIKLADENFMLRKELNSYKNTFLRKAFRHLKNKIA